MPRRPASPSRTYEKGLAKHPPWGVCGSGGWGEPASRAPPRVVHSPQGSQARAWITARSTLSAGERQLVTLVRAYLSSASLAILDEAACHLDPMAEAQVEEAFARRQGSLIVIAHRISSALRARRILVMDGARVLVGIQQELLGGSALPRSGRALARACASDPQHLRATARQDRGSVQVQRRTAPGACGPYGGTRTPKATENQPFQLLRYTADIHSINATNDDRHRKVASEAPAPRRAMPES